MKTKSILIFLLATSVIILNSCGTSRFGKAHYKNRDWVWVGSDSKEEAGNVTTEKNDAVVSKENNETIQKAERKNEVKSESGNEVIIKEEIQDYSGNNNSVTAEEEVIGDDISKIQEENIEAAIKETAEEDPESVTDTKGSEGGIGNLLLVAVLIALAIVLLITLDGALGGILGLILLIFIILLLLRYFGVI